MNPGSTFENRREPPRTQGCAAIGPGWCGHCRRGESHSTHPSSEARIRGHVSSPVPPTPETRKFSYVEANRIHHSFHRVVRRRWRIRVRAQDEQSPLGNLRPERPPSPLPGNVSSPWIELFREPEGPYRAAEGSPHAPTSGRSSPPDCGSTIGQIITEDAPGRRMHRRSQRLRRIPGPIFLWPSEDGRRSRHGRVGQRSV